MIIVKLQSGLGNQFFQYAFGKSLALKHNTELILDVGRFATDDLRDYKLNHFQIDATVVNDFQSLELLFKHPALVMKARTGKFRDVTDKFWQNTDVDSITDNSVLRGYWANDLYFKNIRSLLLDELSLKPEDETPHYKMAKKKIEATESVAVHIRRGDYLHDTNKHIFNLLDKTYYESAMSVINEKAVNPMYYIFSDSIPWVKEHFNLPANHEIISDDLLLDVHELSLMRHCKHNIIANSTFSWWGAWLNTNPGKIMISPKTWYHKEEAQRAYETGAVLNCREFVRV